MLRKSFELSDVGLLKRYIIRLADPIGPAMEPAVCRAKTEASLVSVMDAA
jgi:hypothetical protein